MIAEQKMSYEQMRQALLDRFLPYQQQDMNCRRIVAYIQSSQVTDQIIERMRMRLEMIRQERTQQQAQKIQQIRLSTQEQSLLDSKEAEQLLELV